MPDWISAEDACDRLGVRAQTLYAYVSRGRLQVRPDPDDSRRSLYRAADVAALTERKSRSRKVSDVAAGAIHWGEPVLASAITTVHGGRLYYRGRDAIGLAETESLEAVARAGAVTVFTRSTPVYGFQHNDIYLDDASLVVVGSGPVPAPTSAPGNPPAPTAAPTQVTGLRYVAVPGDNYYRIARRFGITVNALLAANPGARPNVLYVGQVLIIPGVSGAPAPTPGARN